MPDEETPATGGRASKSGAPQGAAERVAQVHRQARPTFALAALFAVAAPISAIAPHQTGLWLPIHLFLVGAILGSIVAATQLLAVTWSASPAPAPWLANSERGLLFGGVAVLAFGREANLDPLIGVGGTAVIAALVLLIVSLLKIRAGAVTDRYRPAIHGYCIAAVFGIFGSALGTALASGAFVESHGKVRGMHLSANALGLVGLVIASTLPYFVATQARMKMSRAATPARVHLMVGWLTASTIVAMTGSILGVDLLGAFGFWCYGIGVIGLTLLLPHIGRKQIDWAGPRLVQLGAGLFWWVLALVLMGSNSATGSPSLNTALTILVVGGYAQILFASLAYFAPVILAGKRKPGDGLRITKSWTALVAANIAAIGALLATHWLLAAGIVVWLLAGAVRVVELGRFAKAQAKPQTQI